MTNEELLGWFGDLDKRAAVVPRDAEGFYRDRPGANWLAEAESALATVFPPAHPCQVQWAKILATTRGPGSALEVAAGIFGAALSLLEAGRLNSLLDGIRAETVGEVLDQAAFLLPRYHVAAAVLIGGALETHLLHLCQRHGVTWSGDGSIAKYSDAIAQARKAGSVVVYGATEGKLVNSWGGIRNDAAHDPTHFSHTPEGVGRMLGGVREFLARVP